MELPTGVFENASYAVEFAADGKCRASASSFTPVTRTDMPRACAWKASGKEIRLELTFYILTQYMKIRGVPRFETNMTDWYDREGKRREKYSGKFVYRDAGGALLSMFRLSPDGSCAWQNYSACSWIETSPDFVRFEVKTTTVLMRRETDGKTELYDKGGGSSFSLTDRPLLKEPESEPGRTAWFLGNGSVTALAVSPDGLWVASGHEQINTTAVHLWHAKEGFKGVLHGHRRGVGVLDFSSDGKRLISLGYEGDAKIWDLASRKCLVSLKGNYTAIAWSGENILALGENGRLAKLDAAGEEFSARQITPGWRQYLGKTGLLALDDKSGRAELFSPHGDKKSEFSPGKFRIDIAALSGDGKSVALTTSTDVYLYGSSASAPALSWKSPRVYSLAFSSDGGILFVGQQSSVAFIDVGTAQVLRHTFALGDVFGFGAHDVTALADLPGLDGVVAGCADGSIRIFKYKPESLQK